MLELYVNELQEKLPFNVSIEAFLIASFHKQLYKECTRGYNTLSTQEGGNLCLI